MVNDYLSDAPACVHVTVRCPCSMRAIAVCRMRPMHHTSFSYPLHVFRSPRAALAAGAPLQSAE
eukprot:1138151-Pelagomonas_calceolata.AAC.4